MNLIPKNWQTYWFSPRPLLDLAICRIIAVTVQLYYCCNFIFYNQKIVNSVNLPDIYQPLPFYNQIVNSVNLPDSIYQPLPILQLLTFPLGSEYRPNLAALMVIFIMTIISGFLSLIGWKTRFNLLVFAYVNLFLQTYIYSFYGGYTPHSSSLMLITLFIFAFSPAGQVLSIDDWYRFLKSKKKLSNFKSIHTYWSTLSNQSSRFASWPLLLVQWMFALTYLSAALTKLKSGLVWMNGYTLQYYLMYIGWIRDIDLGLWLSQYHTLAVIFSWIAVTWELTFLLVLVFPRLTWIYLPLGVAFHSGIYLVFGLNFFKMIALYSVFIPWSSLIWKLFHYQFISEKNKRRYS